MLPILKREIYINSAVLFFFGVNEFVSFSVKYKF